MPILVGIVGPRTLSQGQRQGFGERFHALIADLDRLLPDVPKALVTGGGPGVELEAVRVMLARTDGRARYPCWSAAIVLPMDLNLHREAFSGPDHAADLVFLDELAADHPRATVKQLRHLLVEPFDDARLEPDGLARVDNSSLSAAAGGAESPARRQHYEQYALWLARYATIYVAAASMSAEAAMDAVGGLGRAVAFRRVVELDATAEAIIARSSELLTGSRLDEPDGGYVLLLDDAPPLRRAWRPWRPRPLSWVKVLRPIQMFYDSRDGHSDVREAREAIFREPMRDDMEPGDSHAGRLRGALAAATGFQKIHERQRPGFSRSLEPSRPARFGDEHPAAFLEAVRAGDAALGEQSASAAAWTRLAQRWCATFFVAAIASYEYYTELTHDQPLALLSYLLCLAAIVAIVGALHLTKVQMRAEDYRGLREMMRVQIAWWSTGVERMVDRVHLRTINNDLRLTREAMATTAMWAVLRVRAAKTFSIPPRVDAEGRDIGYAQAAEWISGQRDYFQNQSRGQFGAKQVAETSFRVALGSALLSLFALWAVRQFYPEYDLSNIVRSVDLPARAATPILAALAAGGVLWTITRSVIGSSDRARELADMMVKRRAGQLAMHPIAFLLSSHGATAFLPAPLLLAALVFLLGIIGLDCIPRGWESAHIPRAWAGEMPAWAFEAMFLVVLAVVTVIRIPDRSLAFRVRKFGRARYAIAIVVMTSLQVTMAIVFAPAIAILSELGPAESSHPPIEKLLSEGYHGLLLAQALILLTGAGMVRWYTERRNHLAQAEHYADMFRVFRRAEDWLRDAPRNFGPREHEQLLELGGVALDESEAWLKAHREKPPEAIAG